MNTQYKEVGIDGQNPVCRFSPKCLEHTQEQEIEIGWLSYQQEQP